MVSTRVPVVSVGPWGVCLTPGAWAPAVVETRWRQRWRRLTEGDQFGRTAISSGGGHLAAALRWKAFRRPVSSFARMLAAGRIGDSSPVMSAAPGRALRPCRSRPWSRRRRNQGWRGFTALDQVTTAMGSTGNASAADGLETGGAGVMGGGRDRWGEGGRMAGGGLLAV